jgi:WD40 repeat protein
MAPEQARGATSDKRGDVYALGAMLYHLLTGSPPHRGGSGAEVLQSAAAGSPPPVLETVQPLIPHDLSTLVSKAMAPTAAERYADAGELAADLKRFQTGQLVRAHVYSVWSLLARWVKRNRAAVTVAAVLVAALAGTAILSVRRIVQERNRAEARTNEMILIQARSSLDTDPSSAIAWLKAYPTKAPAWSSVRVIAADARQRGVARHVLRGHTEPIYSVALTRDGTRVVSGSGDKTVRIWNVDTGKVQVLSGHTGQITNVALSPDNRKVASGSTDGTVRLWDLASGDQRELRGHTREVFRVAFSPDSKRLASGSSDQTIRVWDTATGDGRVLNVPGADSSGSATLGGAQPKSRLVRIHYVEFSPDGRQLASTGNDGAVWLWNVESGEGRLLMRHAKSATFALFSPDGTKLLSCSEEPTMHLWDLASREHLELKGHNAGVIHAVFSADGGRIASASEDGSIRIWDLGGRTIQTLTGHQGKVTSVAFSPDGRLLASGGIDHTVRLWDLVTGETAVFRGHTSMVNVVRFSPLGDTLLSGSFDNTLRLWDVQRASRVLFQTNKSLRDARFSRDGKLLAFAGDDSVVHLWDSASDRLRELTGHQKRVNRLAFSPQADLLASGSDDGTVRIWPLPGGAPRELRGHEDAVTSVEFTPDGKAVVSGSQDTTVRVWPQPSGESQVLRGHPDWVEDLAVSPDGKLVASAGRHTVSGGQKGGVLQIKGVVMLWNLEAGTSLVLEHGRRVYRVAFSPDGLSLASGSEALRLWDVRSGVAKILPGHEMPVVDLAFLPGNRVVSAGRDRRTILWDLASGASSVFVGESRYLTNVAAAPDGQRLASAGWDPLFNVCTVRLWDVQTHESRVLPGNTGELKSLAFSPDGKSVMGAGMDGSVRLWQDDLPTDPKALHGWITQATDLTVDK